MSQRISVKQVKYVVLISMLLGLVFTLLQIVVDLRQERVTKQEDFSRLLAQTQDTASQAAYQLNRLLATRVVEGLMKHPAVIHAEIYDDFGDSLAVASREGAQTDWLTNQLARYLFADQTDFKSTLLVGEKRTVTGHLMITVDDAFMAHDVLSRAGYNVLFGLLRNLLLAAILLVFFYYHLSRPVRHLTEWVQNFGKQGASASVPYQAEDELGALANTFARLWHDKEQASYTLQKTVQELSRSERFSRTLLDSAGDALLLCDMQGRIVLVNQQACLSLGYQQQELVGQHASLICHEYTNAALRTLFKDADDQATTLTVEHRRKDNHIFPVEVRGQLTQPGSEPLLLMLARDISARHEAEQKIHQLAYYDTLTNLPNRRLLQDRLMHALQEAREQQQVGALLYLDLDRFKTINDSLGHNVGDGLLQSIAQRLQTHLTDYETAARIGGDEFVLLLPTLASNEANAIKSITHRVEDIIADLASPYDVGEHKLYCSASIGIVLFPHAQSDATELMRQADTALYRVKSAGRNGYQFFEQSMQAAARQRLDIEKGLHQAIENNELELYFQPQVNHHGELVGAESLIRWNHPEQGVIRPDLFISVAEETGQILTIGDWVLDEALRHLGQWQAQGLPASFERLAVNVSPQQFLQSDFVSDTLARLEKAGIPGHRLEIEVTENMLLGQIQMAEEKMCALKRQGVRMAIDDFGTGYSSLSYLKYLSAEMLKIDRSFVKKLHEAESDIAIVDTIIVMADKLGMDVIAEGVETKAELDTLIKLGCKRYQGFLFDKPLPASAFQQRLLSTDYPHITTHATTALPD